MASLDRSLSSLLLSKTHPFRPQNPTPRFLFPQTLSSFKVSAKIQQQKSNGSSRESSISEKKSFAVVTGELFLGLASMLVRRVNSNKGSDSGPPVGIFDEREKSVQGPYAQVVQDRIASVVEDSINPDVIWEQRLKDVEAERGLKKVTSPGFSFSAAGLLFPYHLGVAQFLLEKGYIKAVLRDVLDKFLPDDVHIRSNGRVRVAVTQILWRPRGLLVDQFDSKEDLIDAVFTSSFIPGYLAPRPATIFRNRLCIDGGLTLFMPPTSASETVRVCAFPADRLGLRGIGISPDCNPENRATPRELLTWALEPAEDEILDRLFELGYLDAAVWAEQNPMEAIVQDDRITEST
ncbi:uncharacterized protein LOC131242537 isoform X2 [Magnolia sinica]|uniref:uncharacterized protein LOC131242537 isoform X2 n=1 Tax=Magnolia sinica TaxID=86752 RepID=UPI0026589AF3|nr:uncharacterized protein LOC131242537 isoform X2 [Magnolia sinica]